MGRGRSTRIRSVIVLVALGLSACAQATAPGERIGGEPQSYGSGLAEDVVPRTNAPKSAGAGGAQATAPKKGSFVVTVRDGSAPIPGIVISFRGPVSGTVTTDARGRAKRFVTPGAYTLDLRTCGTTVHVLQGGGAQLTVQPGQATKGEITQIGWEPRYWPLQKVKTSPFPSWTPGEPFTLRTRVGDRCHGGKPVSRSVSLPTWTYEVTTPMHLNGTPSMRSDKNGWLSARFTCLGAGNGDIVIKDPRLGTWYVPLLYAVDKDADTTYCG